MTLAPSTLAKPLTPTMVRELRHFRPDQDRRAVSGTSPSAGALVDRGLATRRKPRNLRTGNVLNSGPWLYRLTAAGQRAQAEHGGPR